LWAEAVSRHRKEKQKMMTIKIESARKSEFGWVEETRLIETKPNEIYLRKIGYVTFDDFLKSQSEYASNTNHAVPTAEFGDSPKPETKDRERWYLVGNYYVDERIIHGFIVFNGMVYIMQDGKTVDKIAIGDQNDEKL